jgi:hypothetical protein
MSSENNTSNRWYSQSDSAVADFSILAALASYVGGIVGTMMMFIIGPMILGGGAPSVELRQLTFFSVVIAAFVVPVAALGRRLGGRVESRLRGG